MPADRTAILLRRRRRNRAGVVMAILVLIASALLDRFGAFGYEGDDWATFDRKPFVVERVADGDTVTLADGGEGVRVRLIGVDAAEVSDGAHWSAEARAYLAARLSNKRVTVRLDGTRTRDGYGRLLAYLYASDADNVNLALVRDGQAYADRRHGHSLRTPFEAAEADARKKRRGLWKDGTDAGQPAWRQRWLAGRNSTSRPSNR